MRKIPRHQKKHRKLHPHPKLGRDAMKDGAVIGRHSFILHPTRGWRRLAAPRVNYNLTMFLLQYARRA